MLMQLKHKRCHWSTVLFVDEPDITSDQGSMQYLLGLNRPLDPQDAAEAQESIKAKVNAIRKRLIQQVLKPSGKSLIHWLELGNVYTFNPLTVTIHPVFTSPYYN